MLPNQPAMLEESERKLYTLLALQELGGCTHLQLLYFMFENDIMTYFDLALALHELVSEGQAAKVPGPSDSVYLITDAGREALSFFVKRLAHSKVALIRAQAPAWRERFAREKQFDGSVTQSASGEYVAHLRLLDGEAALLSLDIPAPERRLAEGMLRAWPQCAGDIYRYLIKTLGEAEE